MKPTSIGILGGGLTGLSSAFHLARRFPNAQISLFERSPRLGGWVRSERINVEDGHGNEASILLEAGPRTLRPNGKSVLELINLLGLESSLLVIPKSSPAAKNRFLYIPGTRGLTALPSSLASVFTSPTAKIILPAVLGELSRSRRHISQLSEENEDESIDAFLSSRLGEDFARTFGSALVHGIYAADSREVSVRAAFPSLWDMAQRGRGSLVRGAVKSMLGRDQPTASEEQSIPHELGSVTEAMRDASVYSFKDGMETIVRAMEDSLVRSTNVNIVKGVEVTAVERNFEEKNFTIVAPERESYRCSHLVSALPLHRLHNLLHRSSSPPLPHLTTNQLSTVFVANVVLPPTAAPIHPDGFGYLIPRGRTAEENETLNRDLTVLGVVFDSCSLSGQDIYPTTNANPNAKFTKLTLMLRATSISAASPTNPEIVSLLTKHLDPPIPIPEPVAVRVHKLENCIPMLGVGHLSRMRELREVLLRGVGSEGEKGCADEWCGRLEVVGAGVGGVSVPDCIEQGRRVGLRW